jgi:hypothetical protein
MAPFRMFLISFFWLELNIGTYMPVSELFLTLGLSENDADRIWYRDFFFTEFASI